nr:MAG TPA: hypothetical protein [Caudoviricetes sp.]
MLQRVLSGLCVSFSLLPTSILYAFNAHMSSDFCK